MVQGLYPIIEAVRLMLHHPQVSHAVLHHVLYAIGFEGWREHGMHPLQQPIHEARPSLVICGYYVLIILLTSCIMVPLL